ncbi:hypothetical protein MTP99_003274 [Tenebrio molitor]|nr:hypothetical protein MTP99_003274 [Tenebrio molitor]
MKNLSLLIVLLAAAAGQATTDEDKRQIKIQSAECKIATGVSQGSIAKLRSRETVDDPKLREYVFCVLKKISFMNEHGDLQIDTIRSKVKPVSRSKNEAKELVDKCVVKKETPQVTAYEMVACWYRKRKG